MSIRTIWTILLKLVGIFMIPKLAGAFVLFNELNKNGEPSSIKSSLF